MIVTRTFDQDVADADIEWFIATDDLGINICGYWQSGSATLTIKRRFGGITEPLLLADGSVMSFTSDFDDTFSFKNGERFGIGVSGSDSSPDVRVQIAGPFNRRRK